ncbi:Thaumatin-like protein [Apostasia shenzhenica]|uniref:Thaumatin-like protein n=1 Tax=Apostasia shenzhenica TaxID=1088818 RepID=A0A2I0B0R0_9ASPA|nr:Thaumatin-like protein [Apostasia shenzhenica]
MNQRDCSFSMRFSELRLFLVSTAVFASIFTLSSLSWNLFCRLAILSCRDGDVWHEKRSAGRKAHPVIADAGGFFLPSGQTKKVQAPSSWTGRFWARTGCNFSSGSTPSCQTGDCLGLLSCNGTIGSPPATLIEVSIQENSSNPSFYDVSLVDGYNLPVSVSTWPANPKCSIAGCTGSVNDACPQELQVLDQKGDVAACKSACLAFGHDAFCCRGTYGSPRTCKPTVYSKLFKQACPSYFSFAYDAPAPIVSCSSKNFVINFCPSESHPFVM